MMDKELIRQEIERRIDLYSIVEKADSVFARMGELSSLIDFIDSLPEEPKCIYDRTLEERKKFCKYCSAACDVRIEEEPASEDLEEAAKSKYKLITTPPMPAEHAAYYNSAQVSRQEAFKAGAEWQKQQMKETLQTEYEKGLVDMQQEMMKDAVECTVHQCEVNGIKLDGVEILSDGLTLDEKVYKDGDKVKIIIIKED